MIKSVQVSDSIPIRSKKSINCFIFSYVDSSYKHQKPIMKSYVPIDDDIFNMVMNSIIHVQKPPEALKIDIRFQEPVYTCKYDWNTYVWDEAFNERFSTAFIEFVGLPQKICCSLEEYEHIVYRLYDIIKCKYNDLRIEFPPHRENIYKLLLKVIS